MNNTQTFQDFLFVSGLLCLTLPLQHYIDLFQLRYLLTFSLFSENCKGDQLVGINDILEPESASRIGITHVMPVQ